MPLRAIARSLLSRGYNVTFLTGSEYKSMIESIGATFIPLTGLADITSAQMAAMAREFLPADPTSLKPTDGVPTKVFVDTIPDQWEGFQRTLRIMTEEYPERKIVVVVEGEFRGVLPGILGAEGIEPTGHIGVGIVPLTLSSIDTAPFGPGLPPDSSPQGRVRNAALQKQDKEVTFARAQAGFVESLMRLGAKKTDIFFRDANSRLLERFVQMCAPSIEYPRSDAPNTIQFSGGLPPGVRDPLVDFPEWSSDVTSKQLSVVFVSQGTVSMDADHLIIPTMQALKGYKHILVVVALGGKGLALSDEIRVPENVRIADFIPYDEILEHTDVFVTNGGYGAVQHGLGHGVPLVVAGIKADKAENATRVEWAGVGINLRTEKPSSEAVEKAVVEILEDPKYKKRAAEIQAEMQGYDPLGVMVKNIEAIAD